MGMKSWRATHTRVDDAIDQVHTTAEDVGIAAADFSVTMKKAADTLTVVTVVAVVALVLATAALIMTRKD